MRIKWTTFDKRGSRCLAGLLLLSICGSAGARNHRRAKIAEESQSTATTAPLATPVLVVPTESADTPEPPPAALDESVLFRDRYELAVSKYNAGDFAAAAQEFEAAYNLKPVPRLLFNIAQAHRKQDHLTESISYFERYLEADPQIKPEVRAEVLAYRAELKAKKAALASAQQKSKVVVIAAERPIPRAYLPVGISAGLVGLSALGTGVAFLSLNGRCADTPVEPALECDRLYNTFTPGVALTAVGGSLVVIGSVLLTLSLRRPGATKPSVVNVTTGQRNRP